MCGISVTLIAFSPPAEFCPAEQLWPHHTRGSSLLKEKGDKLNVHNDASVGNRSRFIEEVPTFAGQVMQNLSDKKKSTTKNTCKSILQINECS